MEKIALKDVDAVAAAAGAAARRHGLTLACAE
jgi:hypothetical protein